MVKKKNVLIINSGSTPIPPTSGGAVQQVLFDIACGLINRGWDVGILTPSTRESEREGKKWNDKIRWYYIPGLVKSGGIKGILNSISSIKKSLRNVNPDEYKNIIIFDPYIASAVYKWNRHSKIIWSAHNGREKTKLLTNLWTRNVEDIVCITEFLKREFVEITNRSKDSIKVINNPLQNYWLTDRISLDYQPNSILFCGRIVPQKGLDILISALETLSDDIKRKIQLGIVGSTHFYGAKESSYSKAVREQVENSGLNYKWHGYVSHNNLIELYDQYDILAVPSNWDEPATLVAPEGQARGCKIVATTAGGLPEMIAPVWRDYLAAPGDINALANSIQNIINLNDEKSQSFKLEALKWLREKVGFEEVITKWEKLILED
ncbi:glycosyltransferase family 4 protein [Bacillus salipaludis]|uniref:Glycosyltransferase family 4 protein n=1 Tax=Bacillus salipaludis TaxID=2547811 RepID=A0AA90QMP9_9BACI|nr:glycosyltransferase family 4 protein [Bacillus salipaludis]MDQ6595007.1 glycosyltransferase family 4 protein [Bacillus salipaludis]